MITRWLPPLLTAAGGGAIAAGLSDLGFWPAMLVAAGVSLVAGAGMLRHELTEHRERAQVAHPPEGTSEAREGQRVPGGNQQAGSIPVEGLEAAGKQVPGGNPLIASPDRSEEMSLLEILDKNPVVRLELNEEGLDFLCESLPPRDGFTIQLKALREKVMRAQIGGEG